MVSRRFTHSQIRLRLSSEDCSTALKWPIWITSYKENTDSLASEIAESLMFWLYRLGEYLKPILDDLSFIQFEIELVINKELRNGREFIVKSMKLTDVNIKWTIDAPKLQLHIPYEFMYLIARADNVGEKMLLKVAINGLVAYVHAAAGEINLTEEMVEKWSKLLCNLAMQK